MANYMRFPKEISNFFICSIGNAARCVSIVVILDSFFMHCSFLYSFFQFDIFAYIRMVSLMGTSPYLIGWAGPPTTFPTRMFHILLMTLLSPALFLGASLPFPFVFVSSSLCYLTLSFRNLTSYIYQWYQEVFTNWKQQGMGTYEIDFMNSMYPLYLHLPSPPLLPSLPPLFFF